MKLLSLPDSKKFRPLLVVGEDYEVLRRIGNGLSIQCGEDEILVLETRFENGADFQPSHEGPGARPPADVPRDPACPDGEAAAERRAVPPPGGADRVVGVAERARASRPAGVGEGVGGGARVPDPVGQPKLTPKQLARFKYYQEAAPQHRAFEEARAPHWKRFMAGEIDHTTYRTLIEPATKKFLKDVDPVWEKHLGKKA